MPQKASERLLGHYFLHYDANCLIETVWRSISPYSGQYTIHLESLRELYPWLVVHASFAASVRNDSTVHPEYSFTVSCCICTVRYVRYSVSHHSSIRSFVI